MFSLAAMRREPLPLVLGSPYARDMRLRLVTAAATVVALAFVGGHLNASTASSLGSGVVASVYDGDTLTLGDGRRIRLVRQLSISATIESRPRAASSIH